MMTIESVVQDFLRITEFGQTIEHENGCFGGEFRDIIQYFLYRRMVVRVMRRNRDPNHNIGVSKCHKRDFG